MSDHDLAAIKRWLHALPDVARRTEQRLDDLHTIAFDRKVGEKIRGGNDPSRTYLTDVGQRKAKDLWRDHAKAVHAVLVEYERISHEVGRFLNGGDPADNTLRGTMLGDDDTSASEELARLVGRQRRRVERGEYVPNREMAQPKVPRR